MNAVHLHLMFNHLPIVGLGFTLILHALALARNSNELKQVTCWFYIMIGLFAIIPILTGDGAGKMVLSYPDINRDTIENHETWGYIFFYGLLLNGALAAAALWFSREKPERMKRFGFALLIVAFVLTIFAYQTGTTGGQIRHPEIQKQGPIKVQEEDND